jgi:hypothetical protein
MAHSIGAYAFLRMEGNPDAISEQLEMITRPGVDGVGIRKVGGRGVPFQVNTWTDTASETVALSLFANYKALKGLGAQQFIYRSQTFAPDVAVLDVVQESLDSFDGLVGGLNVATGGAGVMLICMWTLVLLNP